jgi:hypothetical protein
MWQGFIRTQHQDGRISGNLLEHADRHDLHQAQSRKTPEERAVPIKKAKIRQLVPQF